MKDAKKLTEQIFKQVDDNDNAMVVAFGKDGIGVKGNVSKVQHVQGILGLMAAFIRRCDGDDFAVIEAIKAIEKRKKEIEEKDAKGEDKPEKKNVKCEAHKFNSLEELKDWLVNKIKEDSED